MRERSLLRSSDKGLEACGRSIELWGTVSSYCQNIELRVWSKIGLESHLFILIRLKVKLSERRVLQKVLELDYL